MKISNVSRFKSWHSKRMGHPLGVILGIDAVSELESEVERLELSHDRMVEEIAELRKGLEIMIEQFESNHNCEYEYNIIKWNKDLLAKLNQEGEELNG